MKKSARFIAFYLPQFHPIPENDEWWGKGFTEWTNVKKAKPLFKEHYQSRIPADLGYYDLRDPFVREAQAELAHTYGVEGFCYWHYWFGSGKQLLEKPFREVLSSGKPDFPFCLGWANDSWTGIWHGAPHRMLIQQSYPGVDDDRRHFYSLLTAFRDDRYMRVDGKPIFFIYQPTLLPNAREFIAYWNSLAIKAGLKGVYFIANAGTIEFDYKELGFDGMTYHNPGITFNSGLKPVRSSSSFIDRVILNIFGDSLREFLPQSFITPYIFEYKEYLEKAATTFFGDDNVFPTVVPNWDNTPRCGINGIVLQNSTPELFRQHITDALSMVNGRRDENRIIFIKSWNEWGEGNYLEPDARFGTGYLKVLSDVNFTSGA